MEQWLIRTAKNWIGGPYSQEQVRAMILDGTLGIQDEICPANGYWILLHESKEVFDHLGIEIPRIQGDSDEITENEIHSEGEEKRDGSSRGNDQTTEGSTTFIQRNASNTSNNRSSSSLETASDEIETEIPHTRRGWSFILLGIVLLLIIGLRVFKH